MKVERDIAVAALPFAAGVAMAAWTVRILTLNPPICASLALATVLVSAWFITYSSNGTTPSAYRFAAIWTCLAACGILCVIRAETTSAAGGYIDGFMQMCAGAGTATGRLIDSIGFMDTDTNAIIRALIVGDRSGIPAHITDAFRRSGASHILALSGLHLGIIYSIVSKSLSCIGNSVNSKRLRSILTVAACGLYTLATGAGASILRAFLFIFLGEYARLTGRFRNTGSVLMTALIIHLCISPLAVREVGFQLSYAAMAGIAFIFPWLQGLWSEGEAEKTSWMRNPMKRIWDTAAMSIACQITTGPLAYMYFGTFPMHFLLTNLVSLPLITLIIPSALLTMVLSWIGICPEMLLRATEALVTALSEALSIIASM